MHQSYNAHVSFPNVSIMNMLQQQIFIFSSNSPEISPIVKLVKLLLYIACLDSVLGNMQVLNRLLWCRL